MACIKYQQEYGSCLVCLERRWRKALRKIHPWRGNTLGMHICLGEHICVTHLTVLGTDSAAGLFSQE